jgi:hypothetical protein
MSCISPLTIDSYRNKGDSGLSRVLNSQPNFQSVLNKFEFSLFFKGAHYCLPDGIKVLILSLNTTTKVTALPYTALTNTAKHSPPCVRRVSRNDLPSGRIGSV